MALGIEQLDDFIHAYLQKYVMGRWQDISMVLQEYYFSSRLFNRMSMDTMSTAYCKFKLEVDFADNFQVVGLYHRDSSDRKNVLTEGTVQWAMTTTNYHYDIHEESFGQGAQQIVNYIKLREDGMMKSFFAGMEDIMFGTGPTSSTISPFPPLPLLWWIQASATEGFNGGDPSGFTSGAAGIATATYPNWKNRTFTYAVCDRDDFVEKVITSMDKCEFRPPIPRPDIAEQTRPNWELLTTYSRLAILRRLASTQNDNLRNDVAAFSDSTVIRGVPLVWVPAWTNSNSQNVRTDGLILGVNWKTFKWYYLQGRNQQKRAPFQHPEMSNVRVRCMDDTGQIVCFNRRANFRGYSTATVTETD